MTRVGREAGAGAEARQASQEGVAEWQSDGGRGPSQHSSHWAALQGLVLTGAHGEFDTGTTNRRYSRFVRVGATGSSNGASMKTGNWPDARPLPLPQCRYCNCCCHASRPTLALDQMCGVTLNLVGQGRALPSSFRSIPLAHSAPLSEPSKSATLVSCGAARSRAPRPKRSSPRTHRDRTTIADPCGLNATAKCRRFLSVPGDLNLWELCPLNSQLQRRGPDFYFQPMPPTVSSGF